MLRNTVNSKQWLPRTFSWLFVLSSPLIIQCPWGYRIAGLWENLLTPALLCSKSQEVSTWIVFFSPPPLLDEKQKWGSQKGRVRSCSANQYLICPIFRVWNAGYFSGIWIKALRVFTKRHMYLEVSNIEFAWVVVWMPVLKYLWVSKRNRTNWLECEALLQFVQFPPFRFLRGVREQCSITLKSKRLQIKNTGLRGSNEENKQETEQMKLIFE